MKILITGFTPFPGAPENPTADLVRWIEEGRVKAPAIVHLEARLLPTKFEESFAVLKEHLADLKPDVLLEFGLSAKATGFTLECIARNEIGESPDNTGRKPNEGPIEQGAPQVLPSGLPLEDFYECLGKADTPRSYSQSAGTYVCNHLFYKTMQLPRTERPTLSGFIHIPYLTEQRDRLHKEGRIAKGLSALSEDELRLGVEQLLHTLS